MGGIKWKGRIAGLLIFLTALFFLGCGKQVQEGIGENGNTGNEGSGGSQGENADRGNTGERGVEADGMLAGKEDGLGGSLAEKEDGPGGSLAGKEDGAGGSLAGKEDGAGGSQFEEDGGTGMQAEEEKGIKESPWSGKKMSVCGDSISTFTGYIPDNYSQFYPEYGNIPTVEETWWMQVMERTGMELCRNASYSGSTVSGQSQDNHEGAYACGNQRIADLASEEGSWPDVILILMGTNDLLYGIPMGAYDGVSQVQEGYIQNFSEAYGLMLDKMQMWYPDAEIYCCTIAEVSQWDGAGESFPFQNEQGQTAKNYNDCIKAVANAKGIEVIDVYGCGITYENAMEYTSDGVHPNAAGAALIADKVCEGMGVS